MISYQKNFIFTHIPRTAGTSIKRNLEQYCELEHSSALEIKSFLRREWTDFYTFTIVRNPWDRMVSEYSHIRKNITPRDFIVWISNKKSIENRRGLLKPQTHWILDANKNTLIKHIFRFEDLNTIWEQICSDLDIEYNALGRHLSSIHDHYSKYYDDKTIEVVRKMFKEEIIMFNYEF